MSLEGTAKTLPSRPPREVKPGDPWVSCSPQLDPLQGDKARPDLRPPIGIPDDI